MIEKQKDSVIRRWNMCDKNTKTEIAAEFFDTIRNDNLQGDWWQFLDKKLSTSTGQDLHRDTESRKRSAY